MAKCAVFHGMVIPSLITHFGEHERRLGCRNVLGAYSAADFAGYNVMVVGPPDLGLRHNVLALRRYAKLVVVYLVVEGRLTVPERWTADLERNADYVFAASRYAARKIMERGMRVDDVIPHEVNLDDAGFDPNAEGALYVAISLKRKYPPWGISALCRSELRRRTRIIGDSRTSFFIPCYKEITIEEKAFSLPREELRRLYLEHKVYLNLSGSEGFGLTVYEALKYGEIVVSPRLPAFDGLLDDADVVWIPVEGIGEEEQWPYQAIETMKYDGEALVEAAAKALEMTTKERERIWYRNLAALERMVGRSYDELMEILHTE